MHRFSVIWRATAEEQPKTEARCARFSKFPPLQSGRCEPSALWADGLSSRLVGGAFRKGVGVGDDGGSSGSRGEDDGWRNCG